MKLGQLPGIPALEGRSRALRRFAEQVHRAAGSDAPVLLRGEPGTGKSLAARTIHAASARAGGPFLALRGPVGQRDLAAALDGARGGSLYLAELGGVDAAAQELLLGQLRGSEKGCRLLAGSALETLRPELLEAFEPISVPPLRTRREDIPLLARRIAARLDQERGAERLEVGLAALEVLKRHDWPGNVRELEEVLRAAVEAAPRARTLEPSHLPEALRHGTPALETISVPVGTTLEEAERVILKRTLEAAGGKKAAARILGISRSALYAKLERLGLAG